MKCNVVKQDVCPSSGGVKYGPNICAVSVAVTENGERGFLKRIPPHSKDCLERESFRAVYLSYTF